MSDLTRAAPAPSERHALPFMLGALFILNMLNFVDRQLFGVSQELIKRDLALSDFQLGLLGGPAFAFLYVIAAFPIARLAERRSRVGIICLALGAWSAMTAFCGVASSFWQLLAGRAGVSIGEAGCAPAAHSLISDCFPPRRRTTAMSVYGAAGPVGALVAAIGGGWLAQQHGWRMTFIACGIAGVVTAVALRVLLAEPPRIQIGTSTSMFGTMKILLRKRTFTAVAAAAAIAGLASYSNAQYLVSFLMRAHGLTVGSASAVLGLVIGGVGIAMMLITGPLIDRGRVRFPRIRTWLPAYGMIWSGLFYVLAFSVRDAGLAILLLFMASLGQHSYMPAMYTVAQDVAPPGMRATSAALMIAISSIVGYGLGPPVIGAISDMLGELAMAARGTDVATCRVASSVACDLARSDGLRLSLTLGSVCFIVSGLMFLWSGRTVHRDVTPDAQA